MPIIYEIYADDISERAFTSQEKAAAAARALIDGGYDQPVEIERIEIPDLTLKVVLDIINNQGGGYALSRKTVQTVTRGNRKPILEVGPYTGERDATPPARGPVVHKDIPMSPPANWFETTIPNRPAPQIEVVAGRHIRQYPTREGRWIYAVGGVGFYYLDEARDYAKRGVE